MPVSADYQFELNGLLLGPTTAYEIVSVEGLDAPPTRDGDLDKALSEGAFAGRNLKAKRVVTITLEVWAAGSTIAARMDSLATAWDCDNAASDLVYRLPGVSNRKITGTPRRCAWQVDFMHTAGPVPAVVEFVAPDPRIFETAGSTEVLY